MDINFNAPVGNVIQVSGDNNEIFLDNSKKVVQTMQSQQPATRHAQHAEEVEEIVEDKPTPSFFRTNAQSITKIEQKWQEALGNTTKTAVIRFVKSHDHSTGYFKLAGYTNEQLAEEFNKAQTKYKFTENDFENANKPLKK